MSKIIKTDIEYNNCSCDIGSSFIVCKGNNREITIPLNKNVEVIDKNNAISVKPRNLEGKSVAGTIFVRIRNAISDLTNGYKASLKMVGVGFKAVVQKQYLRLFIGLSHDVIVGIPEDIKIIVTDDVNILVTGISRDVVLSFAKAIRNLKKPEPYNGKGIFLNGEKVILKEGKKK